MYTNRTYYGRTQGSPGQVPKGLKNKNESKFSNRSSGTNQNLSKTGKYKRTTSPGNSISGKNAQKLSTTKNQSDQFNRSSGTNQNFSKTDHNDNNKEAPPYRTIWGNLQMKIS